MESVIITVRLDSSAQYDMEVSPNIPCGELVLQIVDAIRAKDFDVAKSIGAVPYLSSKGRRLANDATLGGLGLWDGSILILESDNP